MPHYENYTTTVIGAHSVPRWYEAFDRLVALGQLAAGDFADAQLRATQAAILEQEIAGIDVITGGEMHRRTHNRHAPPNAMLNHFWQKIPSFQGETKPKPITPHDPNVFHPAAICRGPIIDSVDLGLGRGVQHRLLVRAQARQDHDDGTPSARCRRLRRILQRRRRMMADFGKLLHRNFKKLADAGLQAYPDRRAVFHAFTTRKSQRPSMSSTSDRRYSGRCPRAVHICQGNYAVGPDYDGQIGHRYFDTGRYKADLVCKIDCDAFLIEHDMTPHYEGLLGNKQLGVGAVDVQAPNVETGEQVAERISAYRWLTPEQTIITSSCGFNHLPRHIALGKLRAMSRSQGNPEAAAIGGVKTAYAGQRKNLEASEREQRGGPACA